MLTEATAEGDLYVEETGRGEPVVLVHSSGMSGRQWRRLATALAAGGRRVIVPDLFGHGRSPEWPETAPFWFGLDVERLRALLASVGEPVDLVGHSQGALIALLAAIAEPKRVRSLALYDPVAFGVLDPVADADARVELDSVPFAWDASPEGRERWLERFVDYWGGPGAWRALREEARAEFRKGAWVIHQGVTSLLRDETHAEAYRAFTPPVLLMTGESTPLAARRVVARLGESLPNARVVTIAGAGHMGPLSHADVVNREILAHVGVSEPVAVRGERL